MADRESISFVCVPFSLVSRCACEFERESERTSRHACECAGRVISGKEMRHRRQVIAGGKKTLVPEGLSRFAMRAFGTQEARESRPRSWFVVYVARNRVWFVFAMLAAEVGWVIEICRT